MVFVNAGSVILHRVGDNELVLFLTTTELVGGSVLPSLSVVPVVIEVGVDSVVVWFSQQAALLFTSNTYSQVFSEGGSPMKLRVLCVQNTNIYTYMCMYNYI